MLWIIEIYDMIDTYLWYEEDGRNYIAQILYINMFPSNLVEWYVLHRITTILAECTFNWEVLNSILLDSYSVINENHWSFWFVIATLSLIYFWRIRLHTSNMNIKSLCKSDQFAQNTFTITS